MKILKRKHLDAFLNWCNHNGYVTTRGKAEYDTASVRIGDRDRHIHMRPSAVDVQLVTNSRLNPLVEKFYQQRKEEHNAKRANRKAFESDS